MARGERDTSGIKSLRFLFQFSRRLLKASCLTARLKCPRENSAGWVGLG